MILLDWITITGTFISATSFTITIYQLISMKKRIEELAKHTSVHIYKISGLVIITETITQIEQFQDLPKQDLNTALHILRGIHKSLIDISTHEETKNHIDNNINCLTIKVSSDIALLREAMQQEMGDVEMKNVNANLDRIKDILLLAKSNLDRNIPIPNI